ncbi:MAG: hypothetical protein QOH55_1532 [Microbacteriaceae bacterium]|jgi:hypothetical protein|nr:hypothetical protein [Microbacteriaceae bacterium]MDQ1607928.1 hypothetical protein [Microbacteriaceae bacterium]
MSAYSIVEIPGWENLSLNTADGADLDRRIDELAHGSVPDEVPRDTATPFRQEVRKQLVRLVDQARSAGAGLLCLPTQRMGDIAVPASYTVSEWRDVEREEVAPSALLESLAAASTASVRFVDIDGQPALREESVEAADPEADPLAKHAARRVTYTVSAPRDPRGWIVFTFITLGDGSPEGALADMLVELFDAQLTTLRWREQ